MTFLGRDQAGMQNTVNLAATHGHEVVGFRANITDAQAVATSLEEAAELMGGIDAVVHCAAISGPVGRPLAEVALDEIERTVDVNLLGALVVARAAFSHLVAEPGSTMVFIGSDSAYVASPDMVVYNATKAAIVHLVRSLAVEWESADIRVNAVSPSIVDTPMARADLNLGEEGFSNVDFPVLSAEDVARAVLYLSSDFSRGVNGHSLVMDFGYSAKSAFPA